MLSVKAVGSCTSSDDLASDPGIFVELIDGTQSMVAIRNYRFTARFVSYYKERGEAYPLLNLFPVFSTCKLLTPASGS